MGRAGGGKFVRPAGARLKENSARVKTELCRRRARASVGLAMDFPHFLRVERDGPGRPRHTVMHLVDPKFSVELVPDREAPDKMGRGVIKRICVPNSWAGDYAQCAKMIGAAQEFFAKSLAPPVPKAEARRFQT